MDPRKPSSFMELNDTFLNQSFIFSHQNQIFKFLSLRLLSKSVVPFFSRVIACLAYAGNGLAYF